jgi:PEP-CTERM motif
MLFVDSNPDTTVAANQILAGINYQTSTTGMRYDASNGPNIGSSFVTPTGSLSNSLGNSTPGRFAVNGPTNLAGAVLNTTSGFPVTGGFSLSDNSQLASFIRTDRIGLGTIFVFGDRLDHNVQLGTGQCSFTTSVQACQNNLAFYMNILGGGNLSAPEPSSVLLSGLGLLGLGFLARRRRVVR